MFVTSPNSTWFKTKEYIFYAAKHVKKARRCISGDSYLLTETTPEKTDASCIIPSPCAGLIPHVLRCSSCFSSAPWLPWETSSYSGGLFLETSIENELVISSTKHFWFSSPHCLARNVWAFSPEAGTLIIIDFFWFCQHNPQKYKSFVKYSSSVLLVPPLPPHSFDSAGWLSAPWADLLSG